MLKDVIVGKDDVKQVIVGENQPLTIIAGPCAIESEEHSMAMAEAIKAITEKVGVQHIFKSCYNKDCRSSIKSFHGVGIEEGLEILGKVRKEYNIPVTCDVSNVEWMKETADAVDMIQIPAYLSRQSHLLLAAGETGLPIHIKKGQFLSPWNMKNAVIKIESTGNRQMILTDRGTFFGYNMLVSDMRCFRVMKETDYPVCYDVTHSIQMPGSLGTSSGGQREYIPELTRAALGTKINALFVEVHDNPASALCDATTQLPLKYLEPLLIQAKAVYELIQQLPELEIE
ncbi:MAG: 3-deoxy-8-phosphooctulonate synthase [Desulfobulbaceae bacterium]|nr:3-deoxy-8-phosphooctulonate synthase [Desulfobulbaceae bacterium]